MVMSLKKKSFGRRWMEQWDLQILVIPSILLIIVFSYFPMYGVIMAFQDFRLGDFPGLSEWVGFKHFVDLFTEPNFIRSIRNTVVISVLKLAINFPLPIFFAVLINEMKLPFFKKTVQTISYLPHFISWVVCARLMFDFFSAEGAVNELLVSLGLLEMPIVFFNRANYFWGMAVFTDIWKELGFSSIIFLAAIASIDQEMYEAADIDGATRLQKMWYITLAGIKPTIALMFVFSAGGLLNANFDQIMMLTNQMGNAMLRETADVIDTYIYRIGLSNGRYSFASASGLFKSLINFTLLLTVNKISAKMADTAVL
jgi:putative aldouronate transport system permease protein